MHFPLPTGCLLSGLCIHHWQGRVISPFPLYLLCGARWTALCLRRPDTGHTQRHNRVCMSRYQYFSLAKGMPYWPHTINTGICVVDQATMFQRVSSYQERGNYARGKVFKEFLLCGRLSVASARVRSKSFPGFGAAPWHVSSIECLSTSPRSAIMRIRFVAS